MNSTTFKSKSLRYSGLSLAVVAVLVLAAGIYSLFMIPWLGLAIAAIAAVLFIFLLACSALLRKISDRIENPGLQNTETPNQKKIFISLRTFLILFVGVATILMAVKASFF